MTERPHSDGGGTNDQSNPPQLAYTIDEDEQPSMAVVRATAALTDSSPMDLDPLYEVLDPVHLDGAIEDTQDSTLETKCSFVFNGCEVVVTDTEVTVQDTAEQDL